MSDDLFTLDLSGMDLKDLIQVVNEMDSKLNSKIIPGILEEVGDEQKKQQLETLLSSPAYAHRIGRLNDLDSKISDMCSRLANAEIGVDTAHLGDIIQSAYMQTVFDVTKGADYRAAFDLIPESRVKAILSTNWSGQMFSERVWDNTNALADGLKHDMLVGIMAGKSEQHMADDIMNRCGVGAFEARRLVRTETTCVANMAELYGYKELDIDEYEFSACLDSRTSDLCRELDGKVFKRNSAQAGVNLPPMHPFCRSTTLPVLPSEEDLDKELAELGDEIGADVDFDEWERNLQQGEDGKWRYVAGSAGKATQTVVTPAEETVSGFTPAKSIEEAQAYAQQFIEAQFGDKTFKGKADFKGVSLENANEINRALEELFDKYDIPKISGIKAIDPLSAKGKKIFSDADAVMAYSPVEQGIYINKNVLKNAETLAAYNKQAKDAWDTVMSNIDTLNGAEKELALRYKQAGRSIVGDGSAHDYFLHEMGHHVQWQAFDAKTNNLIGSQMSKYAGSLSGYATASKSEYFAESFVALQKGEISKLDPEYVAFMKGRAIDKVGESGIIKERLRKLGKSRDKLRFISDEQFNNLTIEARKNGANIIRGSDEIEKHLDDVGASAAIVGDTLLFRNDVCISDVLEETHHYMQNIGNLNSDKPEPLRTILNEIEAKKYLIENSKKYKIPRNEIETTKHHLKSYEEELKKYVKEYGSYE